MANPLTVPKPVRSRVEVSAIPEALKKIPSWVLWRYGRYKPSSGKYDKIPVMPNGRPAAVNQPDTWLPFEVVIQAYDSGRYDGVGFVFADEDGFVGVDLDHCRDPQTGALEPWAMEIVERLRTYTEVSPSGEGVHAIAIGDLPTGGRRVGNVEMYSAGRFFTVTGNRLPNTPRDVMGRRAELAELHTKFIRHESKPAEKQGGAQGGTSSSHEAHEGVFDRLWAGKWQGDYPSQSEADLALCSILARMVHGDANLIDNFFRKSGLYRQKWDDKHYAGGRTYGAVTIEKAIQGYDRVRLPSRPVELELAKSTDRPDPKPVPTLPILTIQDLFTLPQASWLVDKHLLAGSLAVLYGPPVAGKTFLALDLSLSVAAGLPWGEHSTRQGPVLYVAAEGLVGLRQRVQAWQSAHSGVEPACMRFLPQPVQLMDARITSELVRTLQNMPARPVLIVIDTFARCLVGGDENSAQDVGLFVAGVDLVRKETGATVLVVHHSGKRASLERGSSALRGAADTMISVIRQGDRVTVTCAKQKDDAPFVPKSLLLRPQGSSCVLVSSTSSNPPRKELNASQQRALSTLPAEGATYTEWLRAASLSESTFQRVYTALVEEGFVAKEGKRYIAVSDRAASA